jgi:hypothetical protein
MSAVRFDFRNKQNQIFCEAKLLLLPQNDYRCTVYRVLVHYRCRDVPSDAGFLRDTAAVLRDTVVDTINNKHRGKCRMRENTGGPDKCVTTRSYRALILGSLATHNVCLAEESRI